MVSLPAIAGPPNRGPAAAMAQDAAETAPNADDAEAGADGTAARRQWMAVLARASRPTLDRGLAAVAQRRNLPAYQAVRPPETGLVAVEGRTGGTGARFILGELVVTRCSVAVSDRLGVAYVAGRDRQRAELAALCDALLQDPDWHGDVNRHIVEPEAARLAAERATAARRTAATKVDFTTLVRGS